MKLVECVPNFSEGRRPEVMRAIIDAISSVEGVKVLDVESDESHNRMVVTFIGEPEAVKQAALAGAGKAVELIDLNKHEGEHPRMGAVDVVPFIPLQGVTMGECIELSKEFAKEFSEKYQVPVYLYAESATRPERRILGNIREGEFEGLREMIGVKPERDPDYGPKKIHPTAGATATGARFFLIAFNANLNTPNKKIARKIARAVRERSGGLKNVQAIGLYLEDKNTAQVSMNLLNYKKTPIYRALELVKAEAARYGVTVTETELIGLMPLDALIDTAEYYLQSTGISRSSLLDLYVTGQSPEERTLVELSLVEFADEVAKNTPAPGGGSVSAVLGSFGAALASMVCGLTIGRRKYAAVNELMIETRKKTELYRGKLMDLVVKDSEAFDEYMAARRLPKSTEEEKAARHKAMQEALKKAVEVPMDTVRLSYEALKEAKVAAMNGNKNAITDAGVAAISTFGAMEGAALNVRINLTSIEDEEYVKKIRAELNDLMEKGKALKEEVMKIVDEKLGD